MRRAAGSFGSRNGANWTRQGADYRKRQEAFSGTSAGQAERLLPHSPEALRRAIEAQVCPWCGAGPYKVMAQHTNSAHGISGAELRRLAGYNQSATICAPDASRGARDRLLARPDREEVTARATRRSVEAGAQEIAKSASVKKRRSENSAKYAEILRMYQADPKIELREIGAAVGMHPRSIKTVLTDAGMIQAGDYRSVVAKRRNQKFRPLLMQGIKDKAERVARERVRRYEELGGDWSAVERCSVEWDVSEKQARGYLRKVGAVVPDGRRVSPRRFDASA